MPTTTERPPRSTDTGTEIVRAYRRGAAEPSEAALDAALGLPQRQPIEAIYEDAELVRRHPGESFADLPAPYDVTRGLFEALALGPSDVVFDLGCCTGRVVLYGAAVSPAVGPRFPSWSPALSLPISETVGSPETLAQLEADRGEILVRDEGARGARACRQKKE